MQIGLFFGSFNPVHTGHMIIANQMAQETDLDQVWLVVSPHNPLKPKSTLANDYDRLHLVNLAIGDNTLLKASDFEFRLPKPSYTIDTLTHLHAKYPQYQYSLIMGGDNLASIERWKNYELLLERYDILVYERPGYDSSIYKSHPKVKVVESPQLLISASYIRNRIASGKSVRYLVPDAVYEYLENSTMYRKSNTSTHNT
jgi:nicotinate-nucleotide adenylyltransferase